jgi:hypothetical protein
MAGLPLGLLCCLAGVRPDASRAILCEWQTPTYPRNDMTQVRRQQTRSPYGYGTAQTPERGFLLTQPPAPNLALFARRHTPRYAKS